MIGFLPEAIFAKVKTIAIAASAVAITLTLTMAYDWLIDDPAVRHLVKQEIRAQALAEANARLTEMLENNHDFSQLSECDRFNELAAASSLPLENCQ